MARAEMESAGVGVILIFEHQSFATPHRIPENILLLKLFFDLHPLK